MPDDIANIFNTDSPPLGSFSDFERGLSLSSEDDEYYPFYRTVSLSSKESGLVEIEIFHSDDMETYAGNGSILTINYSEEKGVQVRLNMSYEQALLPLKQACGTKTIDIMYGYSENGCDVLFHLDAKDRPKYNEYTRVWVDEDRDYEIQAGSETLDEVANILQLLQSDRFLLFTENDTLYCQIPANEKKALRVEIGLRPYTQEIAIDRVKNCHPPIHFKLYWHKF